MNTRIRALLILMGLSLLAAGAFYLRTAAVPAPPVARATARVFPRVNTAKLTDDFLSHWAAIRAADKIGDPMQRCLSYPDPPGLHWDAALVQAICTPLSYQFITLDEISKALDQGHVRSVDEAFAGYFDASMSVASKRGILSKAYRTLFESGMPEPGKVADRWLAASPRSAYALTARGLHTMARAQDVRGEEYVSNTPPANVRSMEQLIAVARDDFKAALKVNPKLIPAYHGLLDAARLTGDSNATGQLVKTALAVDAADDRIYLDWMMTNEPRWGGSLEAMREIAEAARKQIKVNPYLQLVLEKPESYGAIALDLAGRNAEAVAAFDKALLIAPSSADFATAAQSASVANMRERALWYFSESYRFFGSSVSDVSRITELFEAGKPDLAQEMLAHADVTRMDSVNALYMLGSSYWRAHRLEDAARSYEAALELSPRDRNTLTALGQLYANELKDPAKAQPYIASLTENYPRYARGWLLKAVGRNDAESHEALNRYLSLVDRRDPYEQFDIARVEAQMKALGTSAANERKE